MFYDPRVNSAPGKEAENTLFHHQLGNEDIMKKKTSF